MSRTKHSNDGEFAVAIAAAAYAISSLEEDSIEKPRRSFKGPQKSLSKIKSRNEDNRIKLTGVGGSFKRWFTDKEAMEDEKPSRSKRVDSLKEMKPVSRAPTGLRAPSTRKPRMPFSDDENEYGYLGRKKMAEADAWENANMIKIRHRYNKMISMVMEWENDKKAKAKRRLELKKNEPERKRARALQKYGEEISRIEKIAGEARAMAEETRRNDEAKTREKTKKIRRTGKIPHACCSCF